MDRTGDHLLIGYRAQLHRFWLGVEGDFEYNSLSSLVSGKSPGHPGARRQHDLLCFRDHDRLHWFGDGGSLSVETKNHLRLMAGFVITPQLSGFSPSENPTAWSRAASERVQAAS
jgi:hypothetical protein